MNAVIRAVRLLVTVAAINYASCQEGFSEQDLLRLQQLAGDQVETITGYSTSLQRDPVNEHTNNQQYHLAEDADKHDYQRSGRSDRRKVFRIRNPFQRQLESNERQEEETPQNPPHDPNSGASNYALMQYSLPPEDFIQKLRAENPYLQQLSTPAPLLGYTATPQSQYQYPTNNPNYDSNQQSSQLTNQINQIEQKLSQSQTYHSNAAPYQYTGGYNFDNIQSTPSPIPPYLSTPNNQFVGTPTNTYVSSSAPVFLSSQPNLQQYVSSPVSVIQTGSPDYSNRANAPTINTNYENNVQNNQHENNKRMQIDHYDNSAHGMRYPINVQQYGNEYPSSTTASPTSTPYPDPNHDSWQNNINAGVNSLSKSLQEFSLSQYPYNSNQQEARPEHNQENSETHRIGNMPAANNMYIDYLQADYPSYNMRTRQRDIEQEVGQPTGYSSGDYGWKLGDKKALASNDAYPSGNSPARYQTYGVHPDNSAVSQMNFYMDSGHQRPRYDSIAKSSAETQDVQEFAKAAAKAHENMKHREQLAKLTDAYFGHNSYAPSYSTGNPQGSPQPPSNVISNYYGNNDDRQKNKLYAESSNSNPLMYNHSPQQQDLITASPTYYYSRESQMDNKPKLPFDHAKALKNIVPIDVSNVIGSDPQTKPTGSDGNDNRYNIPNYSKEQMDQNLKQFYKPVTDSFYKDKNTGYGFNIKTKYEEISTPDNMKQQQQQEQNTPYYNKQLYAESPYSQFLSDSKRYAEGAAQQINYLPQGSNHFPSGPQSSPVVPPTNQRPINQLQSSDYASILKLNDIPYRLTQGLPSEALRFHNHNFDQGAIPTPMPSRINQNVGSHQLDVTNSILNKLMQSKQPGQNNIRPDFDLQSAGLLSNINGFRVANPFNVDLKVVAEMLKGKAADESQLLHLREQYNKPTPLKLDMSALQHLLLKNDNYGNLASINDGLSAIGNPYIDVYGSGRYPGYQGVKYSRSQEEEENIPIADASNTHPIGAVLESDDIPDVREVSEGVTDLTETDAIPVDFEEKRPKTMFTRDHKHSERHQHPNSIMPGRHPYMRKYPKDVEEPYPLLKPPPVHLSRSRVSHGKEKRSRRRRLNKPKILRMFKTDALFEAEKKGPIEETENAKRAVPILLRPPPPVVESRSDTQVEDKEEEESSS